jgi:hypothetical protein
MYMTDLPDDFSQQSRFEVEFPKAFGVPFESVTSVDALTSVSYDDGVYHYINIKTKDVYSYDTFKHKWLEKNAGKKSVMKRLTNMFSTVPKDGWHIWG